MGTIELGKPNKHLSYLNLSKSGIHYRNEDHKDYCDITMDFSNSPWLQKQSDYLMSIPRFTVPLHEIPIIDSMPGAIQIFEFPHLQSNEHAWQSHVWQLDSGNRAPGHTHHNVGTDTWAEGPWSWNLFFAEWESWQEALADAHNVHDALHNGSNNQRPVSGAYLSINLNACTTVYEWVRMMRDKLRNIAIRTYPKREKMTGRLRKTMMTIISSRRTTM